MTKMAAEQLAIRQAPTHPKSFESPRGGKK
jgi:hypothetical protein